MREEQDTGGTNVKYQGYFDEVVSCAEGGSVCKRGDFKKKGSRGISTVLVLAGFDKEKGPGCGEESSCRALTSPALLQVLLL